jgi:predicted  nucleic acid-binding Zn-ribbon protein
MQKTVVKMRVQDPDGDLIQHVVLQARLLATGVNLTDGFIDRSLVTGETDATGVASIELWPNTEGASETQYRITAKNSVTGLVVFNDRVTVPASDVPVWLHDILLLPPPVPKDYDEAAIAEIQAAKISAANSRDQAVAAKDIAVAAKDVTVAARDETLLARDAAQLSETNAGVSEDAAAASAAAAALSATGAHNSEVAAKASENAAKNYSLLASDSSTRVTDAIAATIAAANAAQASAEVANEGAIAAYEAADLATTAANNANTSVVTMTAQMVATEAMAETADTTSRQAKTDSEAALLAAGSAQSTAAIIQAQMDALPDTFASPEDIVALQTQVDSVVGTADSANAKADAATAAVTANGAAIVDARQRADAAQTTADNTKQDVILLTTNVATLTDQVSNMATSDAFTAMQAEVDAVEVIAGQAKASTVAHDSTLTDHTTKIAEAKGIADSALTMSQANAADILELQTNGGGGGSDPRVNDITTQGWSIVTAETPAEIKTLLSIVDASTVQAEVDALELVVDGAVATANTAKASADLALAKATQVEEDFANSDVNALRIEVDSLDTNVSTLTIRVNALDGDGSVDVVAMDAEVTQLQTDVVTAYNIGAGAAAAVPGFQTAINNLQVADSGLLDRIIAVEYAVDDAESTFIAVNAAIAAAQAKADTADTKADTADTKATTAQTAANTAQARADAAYALAETGGGSGEPVSGAERGDFVLKLTGTHTGWLETGKTYSKATYPELCAAFGEKGTPTSVNVASENRVNIGAATATIFDCDIVGGYLTMRTNKTSELIAVYENQTLAYGQQNTFSTFKTTKTSAYMDDGTTSYSYPLLLGKAAINYRAVAKPAGTIAGYVSIDDSNDLVIVTTGAMQKIVVSTGAAGAVLTPSNPLTACHWIQADKNGKIFAGGTTTANGKGIYEYNPTTNAWTQRYSSASDMNVGTCSRASGTLYFGNNGLQFSMNTSTYTTDTIVAPSATAFNAANYKCQGRDNCLWINFNKSLQANSYVSFDYGKTWVDTPKMTTMVSQVLFNINDMLVFGDCGVGGSTGGVNGNLTYYAMNVTGSGFFEIGQAPSPVKGASYYVKT